MLRALALRKAFACAGRNKHAPAKAAAKHGAVPLAIRTRNAFRLRCTYSALPLLGRPLPASNKEKLLAPWQRSISIWLLPTCRRFHHIVAHQAEYLADLDARGCNQLNQRDREGAITPFAIERHLTMFGSVDDKRRA